MRKITEREITDEERTDYKMYTLRELADILGVSQDTARRYIIKGRLKGVKIGGVWRVSPANLTAFLNGTGTGTGGAGDE